MLPRDPAAQLLAQEGDHAGVVGGGNDHGKAQLRHRPRQLWLGVAIVGVGAVAIVLGGR